MTSVIAVAANTAINQIHTNRLSDKFSEDLKILTEDKTVILDLIDECVHLADLIEIETNNLIDQCQKSILGAMINNIVERIPFEGSYDLPCSAQTVHAVINQTDFEKVVDKGIDTLKRIKEHMVKGDLGVQS